jgi:hypothetical protein
MAFLSTFQTFNQSDNRVCTALVISDNMERLAMKNVEKADVYIIPCCLLKETNT